MLERGLGKERRRGSMHEKDVRIFANHSTTLKSGARLLTNLPLLRMRAVKKDDGATLILRARRCRRFFSFLFSPQLRLLLLQRLF